MEEDDEAVPAASQLLHAHYWRTGQTDCIKKLEARLDRYEKDLQASRTERNSVTASDTFIPHRLTEGELEALRVVLAAEPPLAFAKLAQKQLQHYPKQKLFVLCVHRWPAWHRLPNASEDRALVNRLSRAVRLPGRVLVIAPSGGFRALARKLGRMRGAVVYGQQL